MNNLQQQIQNGGIAPVATNQGEMGYGQQMNPNVDYTFTGGAHGATNIAAFTVDEYGRVYNINEILPDDKLAKVSEYAYADLTKQRREKLENSGQKFESGELKLIDYDISISIILFLVFFIIISSNLSKFSLFY